MADSESEIALNLVDVLIESKTIQAMKRHQIPRSLQIVTITGRV